MHNHDTPKKPFSSSVRQMHFDLARNGELQESPQNQCAVRLQRGRTKPAKLMVEPPVVVEVTPWRRPGEACYFCQDPDCSPRRVCGDIDIPPWDADLPRKRHDAMDILRKGTITMIGPSHRRFHVVPHKGAAAFVYWNGTKWCCSSCSGTVSHVKRCKHIKAVLARLGLSTPDPHFQAVEVKARDQGAWNRAVAREEKEMPKLLRALVDASSPWSPVAWRGHHHNPDDVTLVLMMANWRGYSMRRAKGIIEDMFDNQQLDSTFSRDALDRRRHDSHSIEYLERVLALSTVPTIHLSRRVHIDATGIAHGSGAPYGLTKHKTASEAGKSLQRRQHTMSDRLVCYETNQILAMVPFWPRPAGSKGPKHRDPAGEAPYALPLLERAKLLHRGIVRAGGDKGVAVAEQVFLWCEENGIHPDFDFKKNFKLGGDKGRTPKAAATRAHIRMQEDLQGFYSHRVTRNNVEGSFSGSKREGRPYTMCRTETSRYVDELISCIVQNCRELLYNDEMHRLNLDFKPWAAVVFTAQWPQIQHRARELQKDGAWKSLLKPRAGAITGA